MSTFDYRFLLEQLSDRGFEHCKSLLFPMLGYHYMTEAEVRKIDLCEKIFDYVSRFPVKTGRNKTNSSEAYIDTIEYLLQNVLKSASGSIAAEYENHALQMITDMRTEKELGNETTSEKLLTLFSIFLGLLRSTAPDFSTTVAKDVLLTANRADAEILKIFSEVKIKKDIKALLKIRDAQQLLENDVFYIHSVLLYCLLLEILGEYERGDNNGSMD